jgi:hypothetical protein
MRRTDTATIRYLDSREVDQVAGGKGLGNFEIQDLMSRYNQAESLSSTILRKYRDTTNTIIGKIG